MEARRDLKLRKVGRQYMLVDASDECENFSYVYTMNETAADIWKELSEVGCDAEKLALWLSDTYEVDKEVALADVKKQLEEWKEFGLLIE